jgi:hypothetical protein
MRGIDMNDITTMATAVQQEKTGGQIIPFNGSRDIVSQEELTVAVQLWRFDRDLSEALTREEIGAMKMLDRLDAQRKTLLIGFATYLRKHPRSDVAMGVYLVLTLLSDNDRGLATVSQPTLAKLFGRSISSIADAQRRLKEDGMIVMNRGRYAGSYPVIPRVVTQQYNHLTWIVGALASDEKPVNLPVRPDDCQSTGPAGGMDQSSCGAGGLKPVNHPVEPVSIIRPDPMQFQYKNSTTLNRATAAAAIGIVTAMTSVPAAAEPPSPSPIVQPASSISMRDLSDRLFDAAGNAMRRGEPGLEVMSTPRSWVENGCDVEMDILPTVRAIAARKPPQSISTWRFFTNAIADAKESRLAPLPEGRASGFERRVENAVKDRPKTWQEKQDAAYDYIFRKKD